MATDRDDKHGDEVNQRDGMWMVPGQAAAQRRLALNCQRIFPAFESLEVMSLDAAEDYLKEPLQWLRVKLERENLDAARLLGIILGFAMTCVEADRESRERHGNTDSG